jgi:adenylyltransferase/sulfurtransferase
MEVNPFTGTEPRNDSHVLIDVREKVQFDLCSLDGSVNIPFSAISRLPVPPPNNPSPAATSSTSSEIQEAAESSWVSELRNTPDKPIFVVCRLGNDSQLTVRKMKQLGLDFGGQRWIGDIKGGLKAWREKVDSEFPDY